MQNKRSETLQQVQNFLADNGILISEVFSLFYIQRTIFNINKTIDYYTFIYTRKWSSPTLPPLKGIFSLKLLVTNKNNSEISEYGQPLSGNCFLNQCSTYQLF